MNLKTQALEIVRRLKSAGHQAFWVGGCVRDVLLGREPKDYDIATSARPDEIEHLFSRTVPVGRQFGVVIVLEHEYQFQVATFRAESDYADGRHPGRVTFADAQADALRRDFTVNGLFCDPVEDQLFDWVGGKADLDSKMIRTIGPPEERFAEDHLRLLRAVRFAAQLGFVMEATTLKALQANAAKIRSVSAERVREELLKLFRPPHAARGLDLLRESRLLEIVLPEIAATLDCEQSPDYHPEGNVFNHVRLILSHLQSDAPDALIWSALLHDVAKPVTASRDAASGRIRFYGHEKVGAEMAAKILRRLRFPRKQIEEVVACVRYHMQFKDVKQMRKATLRRLLLRPTFPLELELHRLDCLGSHGRLDHYHYLVAQRQELNARPALRPPLVTGDDLKGMGVAPGPGMGALLEEIREKQLQEELNSKAEALAWVKERLEEHTQMTRRKTE
ncbi:MAG: CCA tRNA nucleotidyltransferase [Verrucomicrobiota bacterium]